MLKIQMIGKLGADAVINEVNGQKAVNFSLAHNQKFADKDGVITEKTTWLNCSLWRKGDESLAFTKHFKKGASLFVEGTPEIETYTNKEGKQAASLRCRVTNWEVTNFVDDPAEQSEKPL